MGRLLRDMWRCAQASKLRHVKADTPVWKTSSQETREWEVKLARLRIGHCCFTHEYLLKGYSASHCQECIVPLTVRHLLSECPNFNNERRQIFSKTSGIGLLREILGDNSSVAFNGKTFTFLKRIGFYHRL